MRSTLATWNTAGLVALAAAAVAVGATSARAEEDSASDCAGVEGEIAKLVCADPGLAELDRDLAGVYGASREALEKRPDAWSQSAADLEARQLDWLEQRNGCGAAEDPRECVESLYQKRIAELQARYDLTSHGPPIVFECASKKPSQIVATFYETEWPTVRLQRRKSRVIGLLERSASGGLYRADPAITFFTKGVEALVEWPPAKRFQCRVGMGG